MNQLTTDILEMDTIRSLEQEAREIRTILRGISNNDNLQDIMRLLNYLKFYDKYISELEIANMGLQVRLKNQGELEMRNLELVNKLASLALRHYV